ncbi:MAG: molybdenum cofactor guanylyltransferase MobA, partial [Rhodospirillaceae bacterium]|nr:molybdenum cofactor guanylyltransferase MobA [Rhodospirillaceae bacterium]
AVSNGQRHPVVGLWSVAHRMELRYALIEEGVRKVDAWTGRYKVADVEFSTDPVDPFFNANDENDLAEAQKLAQGH